MLATYFSEDQNRLFSSGRDGTVREWNVESGELLRTIQAPSSDLILVSPNLRQAVTPDADAFNLLDLESGETTLSIPHSIQGSYGVDFSPDGSIFLFATQADSTVQMWDAASGDRLASFTLTSIALNNGEFSPDGNRFVQAAMDGVARVFAPFDSGSDTAADSLPHDALVGFIDYSADGRYMATASYDKSVKVWDVESGALLSTLTGDTAAINGVVFSSDGRRVISRAVDGAHRIWEWETGRQIGVYEPDPEEFLENAERQGGIYSGPTLSIFGNLSLSISPDGSRFVARTDSGIGIIDATSGDIFATLESTDETTGIDLSRFDFSPDGALIGMTQTNFLRVYNAETGVQVHVLEGHTDSIVYFEFSADGESIVTASLDGTAKIWDVDTGAELQTLTGHQAFMMDARFNKVGDRVITASADNTAKLWDAESGEELVTFRGHSVFLLGADFSPDETRILTYARDNTAKLWDLEGHELVSLTGGEGEITHAVWSPDGSQIATAWRDGTVRTFNAVSWKEISEMGDDETPFEERLSMWRNSVAP